VPCNRPCCSPLAERSLRWLEKMDTLAKPTNRESHRCPEAALPYTSAAYWKAEPQISGDRSPITSLLDRAFQRFIANMVAQLNHDERQRPHIPESVTIWLPSRPSMVALFGDVALFGTWWRTFRADLPAPPGPPPLLVPS
jgi:hypothetical protein